MYFEKIPVAKVKKIAEQFSAQEEIKKPTSQAESLPNTTPVREEWRGLAEQIQQETDSDKMIDLVQQLIAKFDKEKTQKETGRHGRS